MKSVVVGGGGESRRRGGDCRGGDGVEQGEWEQKKTCSYCDSVEIKTIRTNMMTFALEMHNKNPPTLN
jgi:hypothetical protein